MDQSKIDRPRPMNFREAMTVAPFFVGFTNKVSFEYSTPAWTLPKLIFSHLSFDLNSQFGVHFSIQKIWNQFFFLKYADKLRACSRQAGDRETRSSELSPYSEESQRRTA